jgi:hypothetical protein
MTVGAMKLGPRTRLDAANAARTGKSGPRTTGKTLVDTQASRPAENAKSERSARRTQQGELPDHPAPLLFARPDFSLYTSLATLPQRAGVSASMLPWLVAKELADNALDAADAAGRPGAVDIGIDCRGNLTVADKGTGIPDATPQWIASLFCVARPMLSSKLLRRPTRGAVGNGLRVCLGYLTATRGRLIIETSNLRVELAPEIDGTSCIVSSETIEPIEGLTLTVMVANDAPFTAEHLAWAHDAIELARQSGNPAFAGRPSPYWFDLDHFRVLLRTAVGNVSVRQFLGELDGCTGSRAQRRPNCWLQHRAARSRRNPGCYARWAAARWSPPATRSPRARLPRASMRRTRRSRSWSSAGRMDSSQKNRRIR